MDHAALYAERLKTPDEAAALIRSGARIAMGRAMTSEMGTAARSAICFGTSSPRISDI